MIDRRIERLFSPPDRTQPELQAYSQWSDAAFEKTLRILHFISLFTAGLAQAGQDVLWITDEDEIAANETRLRQLTELCSRAMSHYLTYNLGHLRCGTTNVDNGSREIEDLAAIPDLVAGALADVLTTHRADDLLPQGEVIIPLARNLSEKTAMITSWFATNQQPLKRLVYVSNPARESSRTSWTAWCFMGAEIRSTCSQ